MASQRISNLEKLLGKVQTVNGFTDPAPGLPRDEIIAGLQSVGIDAAEMLVEIYQWHNGIEELDAFTSLLPLADAIALYQNFREIRAEDRSFRWKPTWFPLIDINGDLQLCIDILSGEIHAIDLESNNITKVAKAADDLIAAIARVLDADAFTFDPEGGCINFATSEWQSAKREFGINDF